MRPEITDIQFRKDLLWMLESESLFEGAIVWDELEGWMPPGFWHSLLHGEAAASSDFVPTNWGLEQRRKFPHLIREAALPEAAAARFAGGKRVFLGKYFEELLLWWFTHSPDYRLVAHSLQVFDDRQTIGEFDYILQNVHTGEFEHWETAVKFYLATDDDGAAWIGPNARDRLSNKLQKLLEKQVQLKYHPAGKLALEKMGIDEIADRILMKGYLFYPFAEAPAMMPPLVNPRHGRGWWLKAAEATRMLQPEFRYKVLEKPDWLRKQEGLSEDELMRADAVQKYLGNHFEHSLKARLICRLQRQEGGSWSETDRGFVVPATWPVQGDE